jgi:hypothetical protein
MGQAMDVCGSMGKLDNSEHLYSEWIDEAYSKGSRAERRQGEEPTMHSPLTRLS